MTDKITHIQDQLLVMDAQAGSRAALEELVRRWYSKLRQHAFNLTSDQQAAWDIAQKSWYDIIRGLRRLNDPAHFQAWAYKITTHRAMDWLRDQRRHQHTSLFSTEALCTCQEEDSDGLPPFLVPVVMGVSCTYSPCLEEGGACRSTTERMSPPITEKVFF
jgi:RNA polymerase sigma factor (sigma-70 family)